MSAGGSMLSRGDLDKIALLAGVPRATVERVLLLQAKSRARQLPEEMKQLLFYVVRAERGERETVYFVQAEHRGRIKIGTTKNLTRRMRALRAGSPVSLHLIESIRGGRRLEQMLHIAFAPLRCGRTEWFEPGESLLSYIRDLRPGNDDAKTRKVGT